MPSHTYIYRQISIYIFTILLGHAVTSRALFLKVLNGFQFPCFLIFNMIIVSWGVNRSVIRCLASGARQRQRTEEEGKERGRRRWQESVKCARDASELHLGLCNKHSGAHSGTQCDKCNLNQGEIHANKLTTV